MHYLVTASGAPLSGRPLSYKELPEGMAYYPTFAKRAVKPLLDNFAANAELLIAAAGKLGGKKTEGGDASFVINALPRVPVTVTLWWADGEFPAEGSLLFDSSITGYLPTEDITVLCEIMAWKLVKMSHQDG